MRRISEDIEDLINEISESRAELLILSTYFTSKFDSNRDTKQKSNSYPYIQFWHESVIEFGLKAIVFHDSLSKEFIRKYENSSIRFIHCQLAEYSLNDERFFVYLEFLEKLKASLFVLCTDINDVIVNKNPLEFLKNSPEKLFIGRGDRINWGSSPWTIDKISLFKEKSGVHLPSGFFNYPVFNAGLIGGERDKIIDLFRMMVYEFEKVKDEGNYNMAVLNYVIYKNYFKQKSMLDKLLGFSMAQRIFQWRYKMVRKVWGNNLEKINITLPKEGIIKNEKIHSGYPFNSMFKKFEKRGISEAYLIHK